MILERTERFKRAFKKLDRSHQERVIAALRRLAADPRHPALRVRRVQGTVAIWEARASDELRLTFEMDRERILLRSGGHHDAALRSP